MGFAKVPTKQLGSFKNLSLSAVSCDSSVYVGAVVRIDETTGEFVNALATDPINSNVFGICSAKSSSTICDVLLPGSVTEAIFSGLTLNEKYFLSDVTAGGISLIFPTGPGRIIIDLGIPLTSEKFLFLPKLALRRAI